MAEKTSSLSPRDKALLIALPALVVVIGYTLAFARPPIERVRTLKIEAESTRPKVPRPHEIPEAEARVASLQLEVQRVDNSLQLLQSSVSKISSAGINNQNRLVTGERLSALWKRNGLILQEQKEIEDGWSILPATLQVLASHAQRAGATQLPRMWELQLTGQFGQLQGALEELAKSDLAVVPLTLEMADSYGSPIKSWRLRLWH